MTFLYDLKVFFVQEVFKMSQPEITQEIQNSGKTLTLEVERYERKSYPIDIPKILQFSK